MLQFVSTETSTFSHHHYHKQQQKKHVTATADKRHLPRACWWSGCRSRMSWPCWEWNLIELLLPLHSVTCRISRWRVLLNQLLFPSGISYSFEVLLCLHRRLLDLMLKLVWVGLGAVSSGMFLQLPGLYWKHNFLQMSNCSGVTWGRRQQGLHKIPLGQRHQREMLQCHYPTSLCFFMCAKADLVRNPRQSH